MFKPNSVDVQPLMQQALSVSVVCGQWIQVNTLIITFAKLLFQLLRVRVDVCVCVCVCVC